MVPDPVFTVNRNWPSWLISTQHGAVCRSANGEDPIDDSVPSAASANADTVPEPAPVLWALDTNSWPGLVGRNSLPNGPRPWAGKGDPGAAVRRPPEPTVKLSIWDVPTRVPASLVPSPLIGSTEIWLLPASAAIRNRPSGEICSAPCDASPAPVPAPPAANGDPAWGVSVPSACRSNAPIVFAPAVLSLT